MSTLRLTDAHRAQIVERYRAGLHSIELARLFGCSPNTVMRAVRSVIGKDELLHLKARYRSRSRSGSSAESTLTTKPAAATTEIVPPSTSVTTTAGVLPMDGQINDAEPAPAVLPLEDADDFAEDADDEMAIDDDDDPAVPVTTALPPLPVEESPAQTRLKAQALDTTTFPNALYMLVERSVELQPQPLNSMGGLGPLGADEQGRRGLVLFTNPRQARRQCGRSQRVIKVPDPQMLLRTAPYLLAKGISRLVIEGNLYALPGS